MAAHPLAGLPEILCEHVLELVDAHDVAALLCVSKASEALVRKSRRWLVMRFMREPGADGTTALSHVMHCIMEEGSSDALAAPHMVCKDFHLATFPLLRLRFTLVRSNQLGQAMLNAVFGGAALIPPRPRVSYRPELPDEGF